MKPLQIQKAVEALPEEDRLLPAALKNAMCKVREEERRGRGKWIRLTHEQVKSLVDAFKKQRARYALSLVELEEHGIKTGILRKAVPKPVARKPKPKPKIDPRWQAVLDKTTTAPIKPQ